MPNFDKRGFNCNNKWLVEGCQEGKLYTSSDQEIFRVPKPVGDPSQKIMKSFLDRLPFLFT